MTFAAPYNPLPQNIKLQIKNTKQEIPLSLEKEELATWWAEAEVTDFGMKKIVKENFW